MCTSLSGCTAGKFSVCTDSCRNANKADSKQNRVDNHCICPSLFIKSICCFSLCLKYTLRNSTEKTHKTEEISALLNIFGFALVTSLQTTSASSNNIDRYQERGNCDDPYAAAYKSPFTADYARPFFAADICENRN